MNRLLLALSAFLFVLLSSILTGCEAIADIFKAGIWTGVIIVAAIVGLIVYFIGRSRK